MIINYSSPFYEGGWGDLVSLFLNKTVIFQKHIL